MANTITFKQGAIADLPTSGLTLGEPLYVTDDQTFHVATSATEQIMVGAKVESAAQLSGGAMTSSDKKLASQGAIKAYVEAFGAQGLDVKDSVMAASTVDLDTASASGGLTFAYVNTSTVTAVVNDAANTYDGTARVVVDARAAGVGSQTLIEIGDVLTYSGYTGGATVIAINSQSGTIADIQMSANFTLTDNATLTFTKPLGVGATLTASGNGAVTIDSVATDTVGERFLIKNQTDAEENGIYTVTVVSGAGATLILTRATDMDIQTATASHQGGVRVGSYTFAESGTINNDVGFVMNSTDTAIVMGTDDITWTQFSGVATITAGVGLTKLVNDIYVNVDDTGIEVNSDSLRLKDNGVTLAKMDGLASANLIVGDGSGNPAAVAISGDIGMTNAGLTSITANAVVLADMAHGTAGDVLYYGAAGAPTYLPKGSDTEVLTLASGIPSWAAPTTGDMSDLSDDTSPQLGGALDVVTHAITSVSNRNIALTPHGTGVVALATGDISLGAAGVGGIIDLVDGTAGSAGNAFSLKGSDVTTGSGTTSQIGGALTFEAGKATGNVRSGNIVFKTYAAGSTDNYAVSDASATSITISGAGNLDGATISGGSFA